MSTPEAPENTPSATASTSEPAAAPKPKQENALANLLLNVLLPVLILNKCSKPGQWYSLGPKWALVLAVLLPLAYFFWDYAQRKKINAISIIGLVSVLLTGGLGLLELSAQAFAFKEASIPLAIGIAFFITQQMGKPLLNGLVGNMINLPKAERVVAKNGKTAEFASVMKQANMIVIASFLLSAGANYFLALYFLNGTTPGSPEYNEAIGKQTGWGFVVIGIPSTIFLVAAIMKIGKGLTRLTGMSMEDFHVG